MANNEHVDVARQGAEAIAGWRHGHNQEPLDLSSAELARARLSGADLTGCDLRNIDLSGADLRHVQFKDSNLDGATLRRARIQYADLTNASLEHADLKGANLGRALLRESVLHGTCLRESLLYATQFFDSLVQRADFSSAVLGDTVFSGVDLSEAFNLDRVSHAGSSILDMDTLFRCGHKLPHDFLLGCGLPQSFIDYLPALVGSLEPIQFYSCFVSHSSKDDAFARRLHARLLQERLRVWFAPEDMKGGRKSYEQIEEAIRVHDKLLVVLSEASMQSEWVKTEIRRARLREIKENRQVLFPIRLVDFDTIKAWAAFDAETGKDMAVEIREYHILDFSNWKDHDSFEAAFKRLLVDLKKSAEPAGGAAPE